MKMFAVAVMGVLLSVPHIAFAQGVENFSLEAIVQDSKTHLTLSLS